MNDAEGKKCIEKFILENVDWKHHFSEYIWDKYYLSEFFLKIELPPKKIDKTGEKRLLLTWRE